MLLCLGHSIEPLTRQNELKQFFYEEPLFRICKTKKGGIKEHCSTCKTAYRTRDMARKVNKRGRPYC